MTLSTSPYPRIDQLPAVPHAFAGNPVGAIAMQRSGTEHRRGHRDGYEEGFDQGRAEGAADLLRAASALDAAAAQLAMRDAAGVESLTTEVVKLGIALAEALVGHEISASRSPGIDALVRALGLAPDRGEVVARLNPVDIATMGDLADMQLGRDIDIVADSTIEIGGCLLVCGSTRIDAQIGPAIERLRSELLSDDLPHGDMSNDALSHDAQSHEKLSNEPDEEQP